MSAPRSDVAAWLDAFIQGPRFVARYPYYAAILAQMDAVIDPSVSRMAVSIHGGRFYLHINADSFVTEPEMLCGVLLHEVHHIALGHLTHPKFEDPDEPEMMDLALEMSANEYIEEPLPNPIRFQSFTSVGIKAGQSTLDRYRLLVASLTSRGVGRRPQDGGERADDHRFLHQKGRDQGGVEHTRRLLSEAVSQVFGDGEPKEGFLLAGKDPGRLLEELTGVSAAPTAFLDYKTALRMFVARARAPIHTYARPNRRFPGRVGEIPGRTYSPRVVARPHLLVAIDTSMSMTIEELSEIARQLVRLAEHARVTVAEHDTEVTRVYPFTGAITDVQGRGGTDLRPLFDEAFLGGLKVDGVVVFTDGQGPAPERPPPQGVLWILTKPMDFACPWGQRARLDRRVDPTKKPREKPKKAPKRAAAKRP